jgi:hypothetical protein
MGSTKEMGDALPLVFTTRTQSRAQQSGSAAAQHTFAIGASPPLSPRARDCTYAVSAVVAAVLIPPGPIT